MAANTDCIAHFTTIQVPPNVDADDKEAVNYMLSICKFSLMTRTTMIDGESLQDVTVSKSLREVDVKITLKRRSSATVANRGFMHSVVLEHRLYALIWWVHNTARQGDTVDPNQ
eukprot:243224-Ditylum_brightwellii.AAC.1